MSCLVVFPVREWEFDKILEPDLRKINTNCNQFIDFVVFQNRMWKGILVFILLLISVQIFDAQKLENTSNSVGEIYVQSDALYFNEGEVAGTIVYEKKSIHNERNAANKTNSLHQNKKEKTKLVAAVETKTKKSAVKLPKKINYTYFPGKSSDSFSTKSSTVSCAINQVEHFIKKVRGKSIEGKIDAASFLLQIKHTSVNRNYVNNYKLSYYLRTASIRPPPMV